MVSCVYYPFLFFGRDNFATAFLTCSLVATLTVKMASMLLDILSFRKSYYMTRELVIAW